MERGVNEPVEPVPELMGPQGPHIHAAYQKLVSQRAGNAAVREVVLDLSVVCEMLDDAERMYLSRVVGDEASYEAHAAATSRARVLLLSYLNTGVLLLDLIAARVANDEARNPWEEYRRLVERPEWDTHERALVRILTIRLREARNLLAAHIRGWPNAGILLGGGIASLTRRPRRRVRPIAPELVLRTARALSEIGAIESPEALRPEAAEVSDFPMTERAYLCGMETTQTFRDLIREVGMQSYLVSRITPALLALLELRVAGADGTGS